MTLGERIVALRQEKGFSQAKLARKSGICRQLLCSYEKNKVEPRLINAMCIADVLGCSLDYLARGGAEK